MIELDGTDIIEHLRTLIILAGECNHITEMGVREGVSTFALIDGLKKGSLTSYDVVYPPPENLIVMYENAFDKGIRFRFILGDSTKIKMEETDLLFIDTLHTNKQLTKELKLHSDKVGRYIVLHDTESCKKELWPVVQKLVKKGIWKIKTHYKNNNGLTILERV